MSVPISESKPVSPSDAVEALPVKQPADSEERLSILSFVFPSAVVLLIAIVSRVYLQEYGFTAGLDSQSGAFRQYWLPILAFDFLILMPGMLCGVLYLARTRCHVCTRMRATGVTREHELQHHWRHLSVMIAAPLVFVMMTFVGLTDGAWHQATLRDTAFTPVHILYFYGLAPMVIGGIAVTYVYGRTRLPHLWGPQRGIPLAYLLWGGGFLFVFVSFSFNEFGHAFWIFEEMFSYPMHWTVMAFSWGALSMIATGVPTLLRVKDLLLHNRSESMSPLATHSGEAEQQEMRRGSVAAVPAG